MQRWFDFGKRARLDLVHRADGIPLTRLRLADAAGDDVKAAALAVGWISAEGGRDFDHYADLSSTSGFAAILSPFFSADEIRGALTAHPTASPLTMEQAGLAASYAAARDHLMAAASQLDLVGNGQSASIRQIFAALRSVEDPPLVPEAEPQEKPDQAPLLRPLDAFYAAIEGLITNELGDPHRIQEDRFGNVMSLADFQFREAGLIEGIVTASVQWLEQVYVVLPQADGRGSEREFLADRISQLRDRVSQLHADYRTAAAGLVEDRDNDPVLDKPAQVRLAEKLVRASRRLSEGLQECATDALEGVDRWGAQLPKALQPRGSHPREVEREVQAELASVSWKFSFAIDMEPVARIYVVASHLERLAYYAYPGAVTLEEAGRVRDFVLPLHEAVSDIDRASSRSRGDGWRPQIRVIDGILARLDAEGPQTFEPVDLLEMSLALKSACHQVNRHFSQQWLADYALKVAAALRDRIEARELTGSADPEPLDKSFHNVHTRSLQWICSYLDRKGGAVFHKPLAPEALDAAQVAGELEPLANAWENQRWTLQDLVELATACERSAHLIAEGDFIQRRAFVEELGLSMDGLQGQVSMALAGEGDPVLQEEGFMAGLLLHLRALEYRAALPRSLGIDEALLGLKRKQEGAFNNSALAFHWVEVDRLRGLLERVERTEGGLGSVDVALKKAKSAVESLVSDGPVNDPDAAYNGAIAALEELAQALPEREAPFQRIEPDQGLHEGYAHHLAQMLGLGADAARALLVDAQSFSRARAVRALLNEVGAGALHLDFPHQTRSGLCSLLREVAYDLSPEAILPVHEGRGRTAVRLIEFADALEDGEWLSPADGIRLLEHLKAACEALRTDGRYAVERGPLVPVLDATPSHGFEDGLWAAYGQRAPLVQEMENRFGIKPAQLAGASWAEVVAARAYLAREEGLGALQHSVRQLIADSDPAADHLLVSHEKSIERLTHNRAADVAGRRATARLLRPDAPRGPARLPAPAGVASRGMVNMLMKVGSDPLAPPPHRQVRVHVATAEARPVPGDGGPVVSAAIAGLDEAKQQQIRARIAAARAAMGFDKGPAAGAARAPFAGGAFPLFQRLAERAPAKLAATAVAQGLIYLRSGDARFKALEERLIAAAEGQGDIETLREHIDPGVFHRLQEADRLDALLSGRLKPGTMLRQSLVRCANGLAITAWDGHLDASSATSEARQFAGIDNNHNADYVTRRLDSSLPTAAVAETQVRIALALDALQRTFGLTDSGGMERLFNGQMVTIGLSASNNLGGNAAGLSMSIGRARGAEEDAPSPGFVRLSPYMGEACVHELAHQIDQTRPHLNDRIVTMMSDMGVLASAQRVFEDVSPVLWRDPSDRAEQANYFLDPAEVFARAVTSAMAHNDSRGDAFHASAGGCFGLPVGLDIEPEGAICAQFIQELKGELFYDHARSWDYGAIAARAR